MILFLFFLFLSSYAFGIDESDYDKYINNIVNSLDSDSQEVNNSIVVEKFSKKCANSVKCKKLSYLKKQKKIKKVNLGKNSLSANDISAVLSRIYSNYESDKDGEKLIKMLLIVSKNIGNKNLQIQRKIYTMAVLLMNSKNYELSFKVFKIAYHKYKDDNNGYYFLLGLIKSKKALLNNYDFNNYICEFFINESNVSIDSLVKFNHDYSKTINNCSRF